MLSGRNTASARQALTDNKPCWSTSGFVGCAMPVRVLIGPVLSDVRLTDAAQKIMKMRHFL